jgi:hypothetical protein
VALDSFGSIDLHQPNDRASVSPGTGLSRVPCKALRWINRREPQPRIFKPSRLPFHRVEETLPDNKELQ